MKFIANRSATYAITALLLISAHEQAPVKAAPAQVTVQLFGGRTFKKVVVHAPFHMEGGSIAQCGSSVFEISQKQGILQLRPGTGKNASRSDATMPVGTRLLIKGPPDRGLMLTSEEGSTRRYKGTVIIYCSANGVALRNNVGFDDYAVSVIGSESLPQMPIEALKAQSVLVQTIMLRYKPGDRLDDTTQTQAYLGASFERPEARRAFMATRNNRLMYKGSPVNVYFHSTCAGGTSSSILFSNKPPVSRCDAGVDCDFCKQSPFWSPTKSTIPLKIFQRVAKALPVVIRSDEAGRPLILGYPDGSKEMAYQFWLRMGQTLGWDKLPGTRFQIRKLPNAVEMSSTGAGHGIGMCQWGAVGMANKGKTYKEILQHYFPGSEVFSK